MEFNEIIIEKEKERLIAQKKETILFLLKN